jgi:cytoskeletal protein CcmA (bactofilin family)
VGDQVWLGGTTISACDLMSVKGRVEGVLHDWKQLEVAVGGSFTGAATVENADISGEFSGRLRVNHLKARASARIIGIVEYVTMEIERGAQISGELCSSEPDIEKAKKTVLSARAAEARLL